MIIATIREIKDHENRVGLTPQGVRRLVQAGHLVIVERGAGAGSAYFDEDYIQAGAVMCDDAKSAFQQADIVVKVKEPIPSEYPLLQYLQGKTLYTFLHLSGVDAQLTRKLCEYKITGIAYETVQDQKGRLPLLAPMSEVAGVLAVQYGAQYLQRKYNGRGITLGRIRNTEVARVVIMGGGVVGSMALRTAAGMGAHVTLFDINEMIINRLRTEIVDYLGANLYKIVSILRPSHEELHHALSHADLLIGAVLVPGTRAPQVVTEEHVKLMSRGSVIVDVSIDQGGCVWGSKPTNHSDPIYELDGKIYCCVTNMPGQVAHQSTQALTAATLPYLEKMASMGVLELAKQDPGFAKGINTYDGKIRYQAVAEDLNMMDLYQEFAFEAVVV